MDILTLPSVLCLIVGTGLIILEMVLPGFGIPGISGIALVVIGIFVTGGTAAQMLTIAAVVLAVSDYRFSLSVFALLPRDDSTRAASC